MADSGSYKPPSTWDDYEHGAATRQDSFSSDASRVRFDDEASPQSSSQPLHIPPLSTAGAGGVDHDLRRRR